MRRTLGAVAAALVGTLACSSADSGTLFGQQPGHDRDASTGATSGASSGGRPNGGGGTSSDTGGVGGAGPGGTANGGGGSSAGAAGADAGVGVGGSLGGNGGNVAAGAGGVSAGGASNGGASNGGASNGGVSNGGAAGSGGSCQDQKWCRDRDQDGHGNPNETKFGCTSPGNEWTTTCDDCQDDNKLVHPGADCQGTGYLMTDGVTTSFDYDCDGHENECATIVKAAANGCGIVGPLNCAGSGYLPNPNRTATAQQNPYCGSTAYRNCVSVGLPCVAQTATKEAVACQ